MAEKQTISTEIETHAFLAPEEADKVNASFTENALRIMKKRYLVNRENGTQETPAEMIHRISHAVANVEQNYGKNKEQIAHWEKEFFDVMSKKEFTPAGRTITNAGAPSPVVANCIVLPIEDTMEGIFKTLKDAALLQKAGSGLGFSFARLRPAGTYVKASHGMASGPVSFLQVYNQAFGVIKQQGRHGANMAILPVDHPDILDFIHCKKVEGDIRNFNISVGMTDEFMEAVTKRPNEPWFCKFGGEKMKPRRIERDRFGVVVSITELDMTAAELYQEIVQNAWNNGEPGVIFLDAFNRYNTMPKTPIEATNPCGEQGLPPYDVCNLGSINLAAFVKEGKLDIERLQYVSKVVTRFLDNVIDLFDYPVEEVQTMSKNSRRLGLGVMGYADMLYQLGVRYDSQQGFETAELVMKAIQEAAHDMSVELASEKGEFPLWPDSTWAQQGIKRRNTMVTTVAPTGSISMFFDTSSGIEPNFALAYTKQDKDGHTYRYVNKYLEQALRNAGVYTEELMDKIVLEGSLNDIDGIPQHIKDTFRVAMDIAAIDHIRAQAAFQKYVENSISKTINFPNEATIKDIEDGYIKAWLLGCKGCTLYRDGSREVQVLNLNKNLDKAKSLAPGMEHMSLGSAGGEKAAVSSDAPEVMSVTGGNIQFKIIARERPQVMHGMTYKLNTAYGHLYVTINEDDHGPFEVFASLGKTGGFFSAQTEAITRMISMALRSNIAIEEIISQLKGIRGPDVSFADGEVIYSLPDAIGKVLEKHLKRGEQQLQLPETKKVDEVAAAVLDFQVPQKVAEPAIAENAPASDGTMAKKKASKLSIANLGNAPVCPSCTNMLVMAEGCMNCPACGYSKCG